MTWRHGRAGQQQVAVTAVPPPLTRPPPGPAPGARATGDVRSTGQQHQEEGGMMGQTIEVEVHWDQPDRGLLERIDRRTERMAHRMATIQEAVTALADKMTGLEEDVQRVLQALANEQLSPEAQQAVDALSARFDNLNQELDAAVPPAPHGEPTGPTDGQV